MRQLKKQIATLETLLAQAIARNETRAAKAGKLTAIVGVGSGIATLLLAQIPELGTLNRRQAAALADLAPFNHNSGTLRGNRAIFGGWRAVRNGFTWRL